MYYQYWSYPCFFGLPHPFTFQISSHGSLRFSSVLLRLKVLPISSMSCSFTGKDPFENFRPRGHKGRKRVTQRLLILMMMIWRVSRKPTLKRNLWRMLKRELSLLKIPTLSFWKMGMLSPLHLRYPSPIRMLKLRGVGLLLHMVGWLWWMTSLLLHPALQLSQQELLGERNSSSISF